MSKIVKENVKSASRAAMNVVAGVLIAYGVATPETAGVFANSAAEIVTGAVMIALNLGWSMLANAKLLKRIGL